MEEEKIEINSKPENCQCNDDTCSCNEEHECACEKEKGSKKEHKNKQKEIIARFEDEKKSLEEKVRYAQAELINYRKRKEEETATMLKYANQDLIFEIIQIVDNFERAIDR